MLSCYANCFVPVTKSQAFAALTSNIVMEVKAQLDDHLVKVTALCEKPIVG